MFDKTTQKLVAQWKAQLARTDGKDCVVPAQSCMAYLVSNMECHSIYFSLTVSLPYPPPPPFFNTCFCLIVGFSPNLRVDYNVSFHLSVP